MIDPDGPTPVYVQIADVIAQRIAAGDPPPNRRIPSESSMRREFGVARETARRAVAALRERGLVFTVPHRGTFVGRGTEMTVRTGASHAPATGTRKEVRQP